MANHDRARAWKIHWYFLLGFVLVYAATLVAVWSEPAKNPDFRDLVTFLLGMILCAYAVGTSILMLVVDRRTWGPVVMHILGLIAYAVSLVVDKM